MQVNLANTYGELGHIEKALSIERDVYSGRLKLLGEEHPQTLLAANNYADSLNSLHRFEEAKSLLRKEIPVARRVLGEGHRLALKMRWIYAEALYKDGSATLDELREAVTMLEDSARIARRVLGGAHPITTGIEGEVEDARAALRASG
jgi:tetratricopeptide (TPR) repeat protein